ncbi:hypothetical protein HIM_01100 [Hirsutella minnesotensis 3608]|nr:hypothetical protein HIM_01100 [Hirsutella minnesotensis 3608]
MSESRLKEWFPWTDAPVIVNAPMLNAASPALASEVSKAGGIGFIASIFDLEKNSPHLEKLEADLTESRRLHGDDGTPLRIGISFITGHGSICRRGAGVVSLVPEVRAMLDGEFAGRPVGLLAAGGIVNDKGVAAMVALDADGVVMGTRFTVSHESVYPDHRKQLVLQTKDGGSSTLKSPFHDQMNQSPLWGPLYDGRAIVGPIHSRFLAGCSAEECLKSLKEDYAADEVTRMLGTWA